MNLCYILLLHHKFEQALRLVRRLQAPGVSFVVHIDKKVTRTDAEAFRTRLNEVADDILYADRVDARWGSYRQALAIMMGIRTAARRAKVDRCILMSGQDYPIASHAEIVNLFRNAPTQEFVEAYPLDMQDDKTPNWTPYHRFRRYHLWLGKRHLTLPTFKKPLPPIPLYHGSTWWALTHEAVIYIAAAFEAQGRLRRYLRTGLLVDEAYVPSLLMSSPFASRVTGENLTFAEWTPTSGPHPKTLRLTDAEALATSSKLFARKFDGDADTAILDWLDERYGGQR